MRVPVNPDSSALVTALVTAVFILDIWVGAY